MADTEPPPQPAEPATQAESATRAEPAGSAVVELLGLLAYAELVAFDRMAADARLAPDLTRRAILSEMAGREIDNFCRLAARLRELSVDPEVAMTPFVGPLQDYHAKTEPNDWLEALTKAYIGEGLADDFYREIAGFLRSPDRELVLDVLHESRFEEFSAEEIRAAIVADPKVANRLSIWARRLSGEALSQAQAVAMAHADLVALVMVGVGDQAASLFKRLTSAHSARMTSVGLNN